MRSIYLHLVLAATLCSQLTSPVFANSKKKEKTEKTEHYYYEKNVQGKTTQSHWTIKDKGKSYHMEGKSPIGKTEILADESFETLSFNYVSSEGGTYSLTRHGSHVHAQRHDQSGVTDTSHDISSNPWVQEFDFSLRPFILSNRSRFVFQIIHPEKLSMHTLVATKQRDEPIELHGKQYDAVKVRMTLTGLKKMFWHADLWFHAKTGDLLKYVANEGPGTPISTITLKSHK